MHSSSICTSLLSSREWNRITEHKRKSSPKRRGSTVSEVSLFDYLHSHPAAIDGTGQKLSLVGCNISEIDQVPNTIISKVLTLYLSNNNITSLDGIEQFEKLKSLSVANNLIRYVGSLRSLIVNQHLERLSLEGNTVTGMPFYRQHVIALCPRLIALDGINVTAEERNADRAIGRQLSAFYDQLRSNELQNIVLQNLCLQLNLHAEFNLVVLGKFRCV